MRALLRNTYPFCAACLIALAAPELARAADHFLTIGGGGTASHNQVSLEKNVIFLRRFLADLSVPDDRHDVLFSDGNDEGRDLQFQDPNRDPPRVNVLLSEIFAPRTGADWVGLRYRSHDLGRIRGPSNRKAIAEWFDQVGSKLNGKEDRLIIYFTGHGGVGAEPSSRNTTLSLWQDADMKVTEFAGLLDKLRPDLPVVLVMVQCHSGGFADVIFKEAKFGSKPDGLAAYNRCGFFATVPERQAAGCTPDIAEENYREYSTYFWAALYGKTRAGSAVTKPDYDGDGSVSFAEAHAYVQLTSDTIDIPVSTSDALLRAFSTTGGAQRGGPRQRPTSRPATRPAGEDAPPPPVPAGAQLLTPEMNFAQLLEKAPPAQKAVIEGLSTQLELWGNDRVRTARTTSDRTAKERQELERQRQKLRGDINPLRNQIRAGLIRRWPELTNPWHPDVQKLLKEEPDAVLKETESQPAYAKWSELHRVSDELEEKSRTLERKWVKMQRFVRTVEDVALAANLEKVAPPEVVKRYEKLVQLEGGTLGAASSKAQP